MWKNKNHAPDLLQICADFQLQICADLEQIWSRSGAKLQIWSRSGADLQILLQICSRSAQIWSCKSVQIWSRSDADLEHYSYFFTWVGWCIAVHELDACHPCNLCTCMLLWVACASSTECCFCVWHPCHITDCTLATVHNLLRLLVCWFLICWVKLMFVQINLLSLL